MELVLKVVGVILIFSVFLSLIKHDYWIFKILEYPRLQKLALIFLVIVAWLVFIPLNNYDQIIFWLLVLSAAYLVYKIWPYTIFAKKEMKNSARSDRSRELRVLTANVYQDNHEYGKLLQQIRETSPDIIFLLETGREWASEMMVLQKDYPFQLIAPLDNTYGLLFFSRLEIKNGRINFLVKEDIPSISGELLLPCGEAVQFWGLHPEPPVPGESLYATAKDKELMKVAFQVRKCKSPAIVFGDLNDVAWSHTTELFRKTSNMLDPRRGRGYFNTFSAKSSLVRFPLDYIFCSAEFSLVSMRRMPKNGSDHFAILTHLFLNEGKPADQREPEADTGELKEAGEIKEQSVPEL